MKLFLALVIISYSTAGYSYCKGREVHYKDGKVLEFASEQEHEKGAKFINRLDYYESKFDKKIFVISRDGLLKFDNVSIKLPEKQFKYTDSYSITKSDNQYFLRMSFDDGVDILINHLLEIDIKSKKHQAVWMEPCGHWKTYFSLVGGKLTYMCEYYCKEGFRNTIYQYSNEKWSEVKSEKICKSFGKHKKINFSSFTRILQKDKSGKRYTTEWIKPDKSECVLPKPVSDEEVRRKMKEDAKMVEEFYKQKSKTNN